MTRTRLLVLSTWVLLLIVTRPASPAYRIAENGASNWHITVTKRADVSTRHAAKELQRFVKEVSGADLLIVRYDTVGAHPLLERRKLRNDRPEIMVGKNKRVEQLFNQEKIDFDWEKLGQEGFIIRTVGPHLVIAGNTPRGTLYGAYTFLENYLGCRWFDSIVSAIPKKSTIVLGNLNDVQVPALEFRDITFGMYKYDADLAVRNKINGLNPPLTDIHGGRFPYAAPKYHTFAWLFPPNKYFKEHPEYYSEIDGKRVARQPCLTNPKVADIIAERVLKWMRENPQYRYFEVSQNDGGGYCQCQKCKALDEKEESHQGTLLTFINNIADRVKKDFPNNYVITFAYHYTDNPPKTIRPRDNVAIFLCTFCTSHLHSYEKHGFSCRYKKDGLGEAIKLWSKMTDKVFIWEYSGDLRNLVRPFPNFRIMKTNMKFLVDSGIDGCFAQNTGHGRPGGLVPLQSWLWAKLAWNPNFDVERGIDEFIKGYYGPASEPMKQYVELLLDNVPKWGTDQMKYNKEHGRPYWLRLELMKKYDELFDKAEDLAKNQKNVLLRVKTARLGVKYEKLRTMKPDAAGRKEIMKKFFDTCDCAGISELVYFLRTSKGRIKHCTPANYKEYLENQAKEK